MPKTDYWAWAGNMRQKYPQNKHARQRKGRAPVTIHQSHVARDNLIPSSNYVMSGWGGGVLGWERQWRRCRHDSIRLPRLRCARPTRPSLILRNELLRSIAQTKLFFFAEICIELKFSMKHISHSHSQSTLLTKPGWRERWLDDTCLWWPTLGNRTVNDKQGNVGSPFTATHLSGSVYWSPPINPYLSVTRAGTPFCLLLDAPSVSSKSLSTSSLPMSSS